MLLPGNGFEVVDTSARVSLANLTDIEYAAIGRFTRQVLDEYYQDFEKANASSVSRSADEPRHQADVPAAATAIDV